MNKDAKGLIKYLLTMLIIWFLPVCMLYCFLLAYGFSDHGNEFLAYIFLILLLVLLILYFVFPIIFTYKAMKYHWSKYLDKFFNNKLLPTLLLILILLCSIAQLIKFSFFSAIVSFYVLPYYAVVYITILVCQLRRLSK